MASSCMNSDHSMSSDLMIRSEAKKLHSRPREDVSREEREDVATVLFFSHSLQHLLGAIILYYALPKA